MLTTIAYILKFIYHVIITLPRDLRGVITLSKIKKKTKYYDDHNTSVPDIVGSWAKKQAKKECIVFNDEIWTFQDLENYGNKMANLFHETFHLKKGDCVALLMENKPEFVGIWYGLSKLGVITALINTNLRAKVLIHSIEVAKPKIVIYDEELEQALEQIKDDLSLQLDFIRQGTKKPESTVFKASPPLEKLLMTSSDLFEPKEKVYGKDILMYIYTSGTTGLPKPAIIKHNRYIAGGFSFFDACHLTTDERFLVTLPIYHSNAGVLGLGAALISGATVVLRKKFSATNFWKDAIKYRCTAFSYVGEICRYLLNQPPSDLDRKHSIRLCVGNGMRENVHREFSERFGVKGVEVYGATEGNCVLVNSEGKYGACGYMPLLCRFIPIMPIFLIKVDNDMNPIRDKNGFCIQCDIGEKGLLVGEIGTSTKSAYSGYANNSDASNKKIIHDVFRKGQNAFNTGDVLMSDWNGYTYFVDRLGDTFRWRGENVSTIEVENALSARIDSKEVVVWGVEIPGQEGKAGMATLVTNDVDIKKLGEHIKADLPAYAKPLFIRITNEVEHTGSFKIQKAKLIEEGYNWNLFNDKIYYYDVKEQNYKEMTKEIYDQIQKRQIKF